MVTILAENQAAMTGDIEDKVMYKKVTQSSLVRTTKMAQQWRDTKQNCNGEYGSGYLLETRDMDIQTVIGQVTMTYPHRRIHQPVIVKADILNIMKSAISQSQSSDHDANTAGVLHAILAFTGLEWQ